MQLSYIVNKQKMAADEIVKAKLAVCEAQRMKRSADRAMKIYFKNGIKLLREKGYLRTKQPEAKRDIYGLLSDTNNGNGLCVSYSDKEIWFFNYDRPNYFSVRLNDLHSHTCDYLKKFMLEPADPDYKVIKAAIKIFEEAN